jgi:hypothetical protein
MFGIETKSVYIARSIEFPGKRKGSAVFSKQGKVVMLTGTIGRSMLGDWIDGRLSTARPSPIGRFDLQVSSCDREQHDRSH